MPATEIRLSRGKLLLLLLGSCLMVAAAAWIVFSRSGRPPAVVAYGACVVAIPFFGACGLVALRKLLDRRPGLVIDDLGLIDRSSAIAVGRIAWADVVGVDVIRIGRQQMLRLMVSNPEAYLARAGSLKRLLLRGNARTFGSPLFISAVSLQIGIEALFQAVVRGKEAWEERQGRA